MAISKNYAKVIPSNNYAIGIISKSYAIALILHTCSVFHTYGITVMYEGIPSTQARDGDKSGGGVKDKGKDGGGVGQKALESAKIAYGFFFGKGVENVGNS